MRIGFAAVAAGLIISSAIQAAETKPAGDGDWSKTVAGAKKEGKVAVFLYQRANIEAAVKAFKNKYPDIHLALDPRQPGRQRVGALYCETRGAAR